MKKNKIGLLGDGRIGRAVHYYLNRENPNSAFFIRAEKETRDCCFLVAALAGGLGESGLELALRYKKDLIDISDIDPPFYLAKRKKIEKSKIRVIPGCGFSPGLVNMIIGYELSRQKGISKVEVKAGSLSHKKHYFPFLWCFEDLVLEHKIPSWQMLKGKKTRFPAFAGYKKEKFFGIQAESYFCASGFENLLKGSAVKNFTTRVIRPQGFREFFRFLDNEGFLKKRFLLSTKEIVESDIEDNMTLATVVFTGANKKTAWTLKSSSRKNDPLNSMQKMTACVPAAVAKFLLGERIKRRGLLFMESLADDPGLFTGVVREIRKKGIMLERKTE